MAGSLFTKDREWTKEDKEENIDKVLRYLSMSPEFLRLVVLVQKYRYLLGGRLYEILSSLIVKRQIPVRVSYIKAERVNTLEELPAKYKEEFTEKFCRKYRCKHREIDIALKIIVSQSSLKEICLALGIELGRH